ncbi:N-acetylmuramoyl-L-alanine amidase CwlD [Vallitalea sp.]|jgi:N-acetylmuramoyl-L-alanine amidase|uniref:N-acetylmuramoyl-L-alanine amidase CwlD n=1 Tax=Vallitalea sp. TaxID=1882829 RepID=UPI0025CEC99A|nr:N-acetylmuramoyl-L-alanine amidase CwlD [Vallitalea sp.]MCT4688703.1 N-acetylmuramoyl-L-alanine amidase CwlD [Vallitalea sp.]
MIIIIKKTHVMMWVVSLIILIFLVATILYANKVINVFSSVEDKYVVVVDAGHGGFDPGKVGVNGELEKNINLLIAIKLKEYLEYSQVNVVMTREDDGGLYSESSKNKKREDMNKRKEIINTSGGDILVSIHQNSFSQEKYRGAQVFYYASSDDGKKLAQYIQQEIKTFVDNENNRQVKDSNSYFILKQTNIPGVIVECGFLSNYSEAELLMTDIYQDKIAWAIYIGIIKFLEEK